ncbi:hypothetical protein [Lacticaseibacillus thailandensis]|uniref:hypothetical protein n=1 Tax=Lacticaseibacillus thailandensis TaxID=381741 RepID=UPI0006D16F1D|nr:hypothetical protein [Lacticaseibacillus thailandensis]
MVQQLLRKVRRARCTPIIIIGLVALLAVAPQLWNHGIILGIDAIFHLNRFYDAYQQIRHHVWSYFQMNYGFQRTGRVVNALYGPLFSYAVGYLLLWTHSWLAVEVLLGWLVLFIAGTGMYVLTRRAGVRRLWATVAGLVYMLSGWVASWLTTQEFTAWGAALMPIILLAGVRMLEHPERPVRVVPLALIMAIVLQMHVLSAVLGTLALLPFVAIGLYRTPRKGRMMVDLILAVVLTLVLTANIWGAMLEVYTSGHVLAPYAPNNLSTYTVTPSFGNYGRGTINGSGLGLVITLLFAAQIVTVLTRWRYVRTLNRTFTVTGTVFLLLSSQLVPWNALAARWSGLGNFLQFPSRLLVVAATLLVAGAAMTVGDGTWRLGRTPRLWCRAAALAAVGLLGVQTVTDVQNSAEAWNKPQVLQSQTSITMNAPDVATIRETFNGRHLGRALQMVAKATPDYLPVPLCPSGGCVRIVNRCSTIKNVWPSRTIPTPMRARLVGASTPSCTSSSRSPWTTPVRITSITRRLLPTRRSIVTRLTLVVIPSSTCRMRLRRASRPPMWPG